VEPKWLAIRVVIRVGEVGPDLAATTLPWRRVEPDEVALLGPEHVALLNLALIPFGLSVFVVACWMLSRER